MQEGRGIARIVAVVFRLRGAVGVHREQGLLQAGAAVVVFVARVQDPSVVQLLAADRRAAVIAQASDVASVRIARVEVRRLVAVAGNHLHAAGGFEDDLPAARPHALKIAASSRIGERDLLRRARLQIVDVEMVVVSRDSGIPRPRTRTAFHANIVSETSTHRKEDLLPIM